MRNLLLFIIAIIFSILLVYPFGNLLYTYIFRGGGFSSFIVPKEISIFVNFFPFLYLFFTSLVFGIWGKGRKWVWVPIIASPCIAIAVLVGKSYMLWAGIFFATGIIIATLINLIRKK